MVAQQFLDELRVDTTRQEQGRARVPEVVEAHVRKTRALQERSEAALPEVRGVDRRPGVGPEDEALVPVAVSQNIHVP
jgi:hypothetical protein